MMENSIGRINSTRERKRELVRIAQCYTVRSLFFVKRQKMLKSPNIIVCETSLAAGKQAEEEKEGGRGREGRGGGIRPRGTMRADFRERGS